MVVWKRGISDHYFLVQDGRDFALNNDPYLLIAQLKQKLQKAKEALEPFAKQSISFEKAFDHFKVHPGDEVVPGVKFNHGQLRRAARAYKEIE